MVAFFNLLHGKMFALFEHVCLKGIVFILVVLLKQSCLLHSVFFPLLCEVVVALHGFLDL
jgi:hypothetical protein